jgi:Aspartyl/asparaginyl-tRNA synthetases
LASQGFVEIHSPKIVATGTEGGAQLFKLDYFGQPAFLAQSPQFYKQMMVGVFERVFEVGPVYRAEEHDTSRHINEYISLDLEMGFIESELDVIAMQQRLLTHLAAHINENCQRELAMYGEGTNGASGEGIKVPSEIPKITLTDAVNLLASKYKWRPTDGGTPEEATDLDPEGERLLCEHFKKEHESEFVYVRHYPLAVRPFYTMPVASSGDPTATSSQPLARGFDLLYRGLEITTGGQRIHDYNQLTEAIRGRGLEPESFAEYLQCFKYGMPPHGGLAIGLERLAMKILGLKSVKQAALFPRDRNRLRP